MAGGTGSRAGESQPKQFLDMAGRTLLERTVDLFEQHPRIDEIIVVAHADHLARTEVLRTGGGYRKWRLTVAGGAERHLSTVAAVEACGNLDDAILLIHDAARPFTSPTLINHLLDTLDHADAAVPALPLRDTLLQTDNDNVKCALDRKIFRLAQTPQGFHLRSFRPAAIAAKTDANISVTDDCGLFLHYFPHVKIKIIEGEISNQKLTYPSDIEEFRNIFRKNCKKVL